ncbi:hypothetical protein [Providencia sp.]|uniref:hypothetical protein n=1 Tax=Providencia sp. TaxID=589 RepID=UPI00333EDBC4
MNNNDENKEVDKQLQDAFDALSILMNNQTQNQEDIKDAVKRSMRLHQTIEQTMRQFTQDVPKVIKASATESADIISYTVSNRLQELNNTAIETTNIFKQASTHLGLKIFGFNVLILSFCVVLMGLFAKFYFPSLNEIENRRAELAYLGRSIENLEMKGARASLSTCPVGNKQVPCVRTDETEHTTPWRDNDGKGTQTFRLIHQGK